MKVVKYLANLGYGTRREVTRLVDDLRVTRRDASIVRDGDAFTHDDVLIDGLPLDPGPGSVVLLHKPVGYVCSAKEESRLIYELLPFRFLERSPIMSPVGRLDRDTSGLLLVTDDGAINHRLTSPRTHLPKMYEVTLSSDLRGDEPDIFASGTLMLDGETTPLLPARLDIRGARQAEVTLTEGRYHQVRRMFAAVGNHVDALHRRAVGALEFGGLAVGQWRVVGDDEVAALLSLGTMPG
jgi:16S rRNA pseudouridine516 synthase